MKYQVFYNTNTQVFLTQFYIYLLDNKQATYSSFTELSDIKKSAFSKNIKLFKEMLLDLNMKVSLTKESILDKTLDTNQLKTNIYYLTYIDGDEYYFDYSNLSEEKLIRYSMFIVYLMLKNHQYVKPQILGKIFPNFRRSTLITLLDKLQDIIADDITKNELNSYVLLNEDI